MLQLSVLDKIHATSMLIEEKLASFCGSALWIRSSCFLSLPEILPKIANWYPLKVTVSAASHGILIHRYGWCSVRTVAFGSMKLARRSPMPFSEAANLKNGNTITVKNNLLHCYSVKFQYLFFFYI